jgi:protein-tyrosine kinase
MAEEVMQRSDNFLPRPEGRRNEVDVDGAMVAITAPGSVAAEQYRVLYHRLDRLRGLAPIKVVALTSAISGEGKSLTAANLALVAAAADPTRRVLLVDADLRRPRQHLLLGVDNRPGLGDFLAGEATLQEVVRRPRGSPLMVLPAGQPREDAGQLVAGATMKLLLEQARAHFDEIYLDVPPVLPVADGALLAGLSDGVALVVRAGATSRALVGQAVETLAGTRLLGCVLNEVETSEVPYLARNRVRGR